MKVWLLQIPRLNDQVTAGIKAVSQILTDNAVNNEIIDLNHELYVKYFKTDLWNNIDKFGYKAKIDMSLIPIKEIEQLYFDQCKRIKSNDVVLLSVFSTESRSWAKVISLFLRGWFKRQIKIGMGGQGLRNPGETLYECEWADSLLDKGLVDFGLLGQSDKTLVKLINDNFEFKGKLYDQGKQFPKIGFHTKDLIDIDKKRQNIFDPDYHAFTSEGHSITANGDPWKPIIYFTQGCVKKCTFCDVPQITPQWAMRTAEEVIAEIDHYYNEVGATGFSFADNTINGSDSEFLKFLKLLVKWQDKNEPVFWSCQYALKRKKQQPEELFDYLSQANGRLSIGFDHVSDVILTHMKKLYVWDDIKHFLTQSKKYNVPITVANWIVGYPTETQKDFMEYKKLINFLKENGSTIITQSTLTCGVNRNSELLKIVQMDWDRPVHWKSKVVDLDFNERVKRKQWLTTELQKINQAIWKPDISINRLQHG